MARRSNNKIKKETDEAIEFLEKNARKKSKKPKKPNASKINKKNASADKPVPLRRGIKKNLPEQARDGRNLKFQFNKLLPKPYISTLNTTQRKHLLTVKCESYMLTGETSVEHLTDLINGEGGIQVEKSYVNSLKKTVLEKWAITGATNGDLSEMRGQSISTMQTTLLECMKLLDNDNLSESIKLQALRLYQTTAKDIAELRGLTNKLSIQLNNNTQVNNSTYIQNNNINSNPITKEINDNNQIRTISNDFLQRLEKKKIEKVKGLEKLDSNIVEGGIEHKICVKPVSNINRKK